MDCGDFEELRCVWITGIGMFIETPEGLVVYFDTSLEMMASRKENSSVRISGRANIRRNFPILCFVRRSNNARNLPRQAWFPVRGRRCIPTHKTGCA